MHITLNKALEEYALKSELLNLYCKENTSAVAPKL